MTLRISIVIGKNAVPAELADTPEAKKVWDKLPLESAYSTWGDEIYFPIPVALAYRNMVETVSVGDIAYWPPGKAFCIFYGMTVSSRGIVRPASAVIPLGRITGDAAGFRKRPVPRELSVWKKPNRAGWETHGFRWAAQGNGNERSKAVDGS